MLEAVTPNRPEYHQSEVKTYLMCGLRWQFEYVDKIRRPSSPEATIGSVVDTASNGNFAQKIQTGADLPLDQVLALCSDDFEKRRLETEWDPETDPGQAKDHAIGLTSLHHKVLAPKIQPATVQEKFVIETDAGYNVGGTIDLTDTDRKIRDLKTTSRQRASSFVIERAFQPAMYDYAKRALHPGVEPSAFVFDVFTRPTKTIGPEYKPIEGKVTTADHEWLFHSITQVHNAIQAGIALPAPEGAWWCSGDWCPYWKICKGRK